MISCMTIRTNFMNFVFMNILKGGTMRKRFFSGVFYLIALFVQDRAAADSNFERQSSIPVSIEFSLDKSIGKLAEIRALIFGEISKFGSKLALVDAENILNEAVVREEVKNLLDNLDKSQVQLDKSFTPLTFDSPAGAEQVRKHFGNEFNSLNDKTLQKFLNEAYVMRELCRQWRKVLREFYDIGQYADFAEEDYARKIKNFQHLFLPFGNVTLKISENRIRILFQIYLVKLVFALSRGYAFQEAERVYEFRMTELIKRQCSGEDFSEIETEKEKLTQEYDQDSKAGPFLNAVYLFCLRDAAFIKLVLAKANVPDSDEMNAMVNGGFIQVWPRFVEDIKEYNVFSKSHP